MILSIRMKLKELQKWMENKEYHTIEQEYDERGNCYVKQIFTDSKGRLYQIEFANEHPYEKWGKNGYIRGEYAEPVEVVKKTRMVEYYEPKN
jgi:hypothetical protein